MTEADLRELVYQVKLNKGQAEVLKESLASERKLQDAFAQSVNKLIEAQDKERQALLKAIDAKDKKLKLEVYTGYSREEQWNAGVRLVIPLF